LNTKRQLKTETDSGNRKFYKISKKNYRNPIL
jgi:hypothetical protein